jgi:DNA polymerase delta subunit 1
MNPIFERTNEIEIKDELCFQAISCYGGDFEYDGEGDEKKKRYEIYITGVTEEGHSVCLNVLNFTPYFYVEIDHSWGMTEVKLFFNYLKSRLYKNKNELVNYEVVVCKKFYPYQGDKKYKFIKLFFSTDKAFKSAKWVFSKKGQIDKPIRVPGVDLTDRIYSAHETDIDHINRFYHIQGIKSCGWIKVKKFLPKIEKKSSTQIYEVTNYYSVEPYDNNSIAPLTIVSYDLECLPSGSGFADSENVGDIIAQIGVVISKFGTEHKQKIIMNVKPCTEIDDALVIVCNDEKEMLQKFINLLSVIDFDIITGYNTWKFDDKYLFTRINMYKLSIEPLNRIAGTNVDLTQRYLSSNAMGSNEYKYISFPGRETIDMFDLIMKNEKLEDYKLNTAAKYFLNETKVDLPYKILFKKLKYGTPDEIKQCSMYCIQDANLVINLIYKLCYIPNLIEMARTTNVPFEWLLFRGQQCKVFSLISNEARLAGYVIPTYENKSSGEKYKGATVLDPTDLGLCVDEEGNFLPVGGCDFASLYPSIMCAYNFGYDTYVDPNDSETIKYIHDNNIPYHVERWVEKIEDREVLHEHMFVQPFHSIYDENELEQTDNLIELRKNCVGGGGTESILTKILTALGECRKQTKSLMKKEKDPFKYMLLDSKQLAQKVVMNSVYGFTGVSEGALPLKAIAESVTARGRKNIELTEQIATKKLGLKKQYGDTDSLYVLFPLKRSDYHTNTEFLENCFNMAETSVEIITSHFKKPIKIAFEKIMWPFCLFSKKRYAYKSWETYKKDSGIHYKGLQIIRRDTCQYVKCKLDKWFNVILDENKNLSQVVREIKPIIQSDVKDFLDGVGVDYKDLVISNRLRNEYIVRKNKTSQTVDWTHPDVDKPHVRLAQQLKLKNPNDHPSPPDRVPYIFIEKKGAVKPCDKVIHPDDYDPKIHKLDTLYYFEHQFQKPIEMFLKHLVENPESLYRNLLYSKINQLNGQKDIRSYGNYFVVYKEHQYDDDEDMSEDLF